MVHVSAQKLELVAQENCNGCYYSQYSDDGNFLFIFDDLNRIRLYDVSTGILLKSINNTMPSTQPYDGPLQYAFSPDGTKCVYLSDSNKFEVYNFFTGETSVLQIEYKSDIDLGCMTFSPDNKYLAIAINKEIYVYDANNFKFIYKFFYESTSNYVYFRTIAFSPDSKIIAVSTSLEDVVIWDFEKRNNKSKIIIPVDTEIDKLLITSDKYIVGKPRLESDKIIVINLLSDKEKVNVYPVKYDFIYGNIHKIGNEIFISNKIDDGWCIAKLNIQTGKLEQQKCYKTVSSYHECNISPDKKEFILLSDTGLDLIHKYDSLYFYSYTTGELLRTISMSGASDIYDLQYESLNDSIVAKTSKREGEIYYFTKVIFFNSQQQKKEEFLFDEKTYDFVIAKNGIWYCVRDKNNSYSINYYNLEKKSKINIINSAEYLGLLEGSSDNILSYYIGNYKAEEHRKLIMYDVKKKKNIGEYSFDVSETYSSDVPEVRKVRKHYAGLSPNSNFLRLGSSIIDVHKKSVKIEADSVFSKDDRLCASYTDDYDYKYITIYDTSNWNILSKIDLVKGRTTNFRCFSPDGKLLLVTDDVCTSLYDVKTGELKKTFPLIFSWRYWREPFFINCDNTKLIFLDGSIIRTYSLETGKLLASTMANSAGEWLTYTPDGYFTGSEGGLSSFVYLIDGVKHTSLR